MWFRCCERHPIRHRCAHGGPFPSIIHLSRSPIGARVISLPPRPTAPLLAFISSAPPSPLVPSSPPSPSPPLHAHIWLPFACSQASLVPQTAFYPESQTFFEPALDSRTMGPLDCRRNKKQVRPAHGLARRGPASTSGIILKTIDLSRCECPASRTCAFLPAPALVNRLPNHRQSVT